MATKYPQYKTTRWIDISEEATFFYGVQIRTDKGVPWRHCHRDGEPLLFNTEAKARVAIDQLRAGD